MEQPNLYQEFLVAQAALNMACVFIVENFEYQADEQKPTSETLVEAFSLKAWEILKKYPRTILEEFYRQLAQAKTQANQTGEVLKIVLEKNSNAD